MHDCDDAEGFDETAQILDIKARQYNHLSVGNLSSGVKLVITLPNGWFKKVESQGYQLQTGESAFEVNHAGGCFSMVDGSRYEDDVYYSTWRVARCSGGRKDRSLIEIFIGDL